jgi:hypothetical protein
MNKKKFILTAKNVINLEIKALKKVLLILLMMLLYKYQNVSQK